MFEEAYKQQPLNEELGAQTFFANVRASQWKFAQQVSHFAHCYQKLYHYIRHWSVAIIFAHMLLLVYSYRLRALQENKCSDAFIERLQRRCTNNFKTNGIYIGV